MSSFRYEPQSGFARAIHSLEETAIAIILGLMTLVTFINVVLRYGFNTSLIWGLEVTLILFAWLVLVGISYAVKVNAHLGVDAVVNLFGSRGQRRLGLISGVLCIIYAMLLMKGAWDYFAPYAGLQRTAGHWFPLGFEKTRDQAWYITDQVPMPDFLRFLEPWINQGERYDKLPRVVAYVMLPFGVMMLLIRFIQATIGVWRGHRRSLIVSHEAEEAVEEAATKNAEV